MQYATAMDLAQALLDWYDRHRRGLPWRAPPGGRADPYAVWLSEIMLQQTTVAAVGPYFTRFLARWPTVRDLARAPLDDVLHAWAGLGYYARARNLHKCAQAVWRDHGGVFPDTADGLRALPGIGPYTAGAIAAIAFDRREAAVDGNVERVLSRLYAIEAPLPAAKTDIRERTEKLVPAARAGDFAQALMDLGATVCTPRNPDCLICPWAAECRARARGDQDTFPRKAAKAERPVRYGTAFWLVCDGKVLLRRRPEKGLLGGMVEIPGSPWENPLPDWRPHAPAAADWRTLNARVGHTFTHFHLELTVMAADIRSPSAPLPPLSAGGREGEGRFDPFWAPIGRLGDHALPTVMTKIARACMIRAGIAWE